MIQKSHFKSRFLLFILIMLGACQTSVEFEEGEIVPTQHFLFEDIKTEQPSLTSPHPSPNSGTVPSPQEDSAGIIITVNLNGTLIPINNYILGTNLPAWLARDRFENATFQARTLFAGVSLIRMPGGSWSNYYDWLACEQNGPGIDDTAECYWPWAAKPTDFLNFLRDTEIDGMYTINPNGTAKEAAALVAFFNGSVDDDTLIGVDVRGRDWGKVSDWARLRGDNGNPEPIGIQYWEFGNEVYGGKPESGTDCFNQGWEDVWTCDGTEYVTGIGNGSDRKEGFLEYYAAMTAVDPSIMIGAVGVPFQADWQNWGNEVIAGAGEVMDFYVIHHYAYFTPPTDPAEALAIPQETWPAIVADVQAAFDEFAGGREVPIAITEYNLFAVQEQDNQQLMTRMVNALYMADTVGQMIANGVQIAAQWDISSGLTDNGTNYGLFDTSTYDPYPQYFVYPLWSRFGKEMLPVNNPLPADTILSVYAGRVDENTISILAINKTENALDTSIMLENSPIIIAGQVDVLAADNLDEQSVTFNGSHKPASDFSDAPSIPLETVDNPFTYSFPPFSVTLVRLDLDV